MNIRDAIQRVVARIDGWANSATGFGTARDKTTYGEFAPSITLGDRELADLYNGNDMAGRMIDIIPDEMLRKPFKVKLDDSDLESEVSKRFKKIHVREHLLDALTWARLFGGSAIVLGADDGRAARDPLDPRRARSLSWLYTVDRRYLWPRTIYDELGHPKLGQPATYELNVAPGTGIPGFEIHESRLVIFRGVRTDLEKRIELHYWDHSVLQRTVEVLRSFETGWKAVEILLTDANQGVFKMGNLASMIAGGEAELVKARMELTDMYRSVLRAMLVDADGGEEFHRESVSFSDIPNVLDKFMLRLAAAVQIPVTILMGQSPAGMNATGESDFRWFYDRIATKQLNELAPRIERITEVMLSARDVAVEPETLEVEYQPLWEPTPKERAETRKAHAERDKAYIDTGVLLPEEVALARFRPEGYSEEISLESESRDAREAVVKDELKRLKDGTPEKDTLTIGAPDALGPTPNGDSPGLQDETPGGPEQDPQDDPERSGPE